SPRTTAVHTSLGAWLDATGTRIGGLSRLESGTARDLATTASRDLHTARAGGLRNLGLSLAVLSVVTALGLVLRRSITRPLSEVWQGARTLSGGDLAFDVSYAGRDEIGDVAAAFRDLHVTAERLAGEIRATNAAIGDNRLDHRADVGAFEGTWAQLLTGMNDTTAAFASLHRDLAASRARIVAASDQTRRLRAHRAHRPRGGIGRHDQHLQPRRSRNPDHRRTPRPSRLAAARRCECDPCCHDSTDRTHNRRQPR